MKKIISLLSIIVLLAGCTSKSSKDNKEITIGVSPAPHAEIIEAVKKQFEEKGYTLVIKEFDDYVLPNKAVEEGDLDANFFQHQPYLKDFNKENNTHLVSVGTVHFEPLGIYAGKAEVTKTISLDTIKEKTKIAIPNDTTNEARALKLLEAQGIIKLKADADFTATTKDIEENIKNVEIIEVEAKLLPAQLEEVDYAIINGNYALGAGVENKVVVTESNTSESALTYANVLVVKKGNEKSDAIKALIKVLQSQETQDFITKKYKGIVVPVVK